MDVLYGKDNLSFIHLYVCHTHIRFSFFRQGLIALKMGPFWPGLIATFLASLVTMTSTMKSNGGCESDDDHFYLIKHRSKRDYDGLSIGGQSY